MNSIRHFVVTRQWYSRASRQNKNRCKNCGVKIIEGMTVTSKKGQGYKSLRCLACSKRLGIV